MYTGRPDLDSSSSLLSLGCVTLTIKTDCTTAPHGRKAWQQEREKAGHVASTARKQRDGCWHSAHFLLFVQFRSQAHWLASPKLRVSLPMSVGIVWKISTLLQTLLGDSGFCQIDIPAHTPRHVMVKLIVQCLC